MKWKLSLFLLLSAAAVGSEVIWRRYKRIKRRKAAIQETVHLERIKRAIELLAFEQRKPPAEWNTVFFLPDPRPRFDPLSGITIFFELLNQAKMSLQISILVASLREFENLVYRKHKEGLLIQVITDFDTMSTAHNNINCHHFKQRGIPVRTKSTGHSMHNKFIIIDEEAVVTGSPNFTKLAFFEGGQENIVVTTDARIVREYIKEFALLWNQCGRDYSTPLSLI